MSKLDTWTDDTVERATHLIRLGEAIVRELRREAKQIKGVRPVTIDRWLTDAAEFLRDNPLDDEAVA